MVCRASGEKNERGRRKPPPPGGLVTTSSFPHLLLLTHTLFLTDRMRGSRTLKIRQSRQLWCDTYPEQKMSVVGAKVHLQVVFQANTTACNTSVQIKCIFRKTERFQKCLFLYSHGWEEQILRSRLEEKFEWGSRIKFEFVHAWEKRRQQHAVQSCIRGRAGACQLWCRG